MDLDLFFSGMASREELASAYLATLLNHQPSVRSAFFDVLEASVDPKRPGSIEKLRGKEWKVGTEVNKVDISLDSTDGSARLNIENKLLASSRRKGQLLGYYLACAKHASCADVTVGAIFLAPGRVGESEVKAVLDSETYERRKIDFACQVSWEDLGEALDKVQSSPEEDWFLKSGLREIRRVIAESIITKYLPEEERKTILDVMTTVRGNLLNAFKPVQLMNPWPARATYGISTARTNLTMWLTVAFEAETKKPYLPKDLKDGQNRLRLTITAALKIGAQGMKVPEAKRQWENVKRDGFLKVEGLGSLRIPEGERWAKEEFKRTLKQKEMAQEITRIGTALLKVVEGFEAREATHTN
jgi:hypothetical protein